VKTGDTVTGSQAYQPFQRFRGGERRFGDRITVICENFT
jgi:hypothetical protein